MHFVNVKMASSGVHAGRHIYIKSLTFLNNLEHIYPRRTFACTASAWQKTAVASNGSSEEIVIPRKKTWSKEAVLQALTSTVKRDPTASHYTFQDDSYLTPRTSGEFKLYSLSQESGKSAAKYFINTYPKFFQKDFAEPHIPCLMPETFQLQIEEVSEAALVERIQLRKVKAAVDMYDQLLQSGTTLSLDLTNDLLDLICLYGDQDPKDDSDPEQKPEDVEEVQDDPRKRRPRIRRASDIVRVVWKENNNAERIFNLMPERDSRSYGALIQGMARHEAYGKAFSTYTDLLNNRLTANVHTFNALILASPEVREKYIEKRELIFELLNQMAEQKVRPNLLTFNAALRALRRCGNMARSQALLIFGEMKALGITPSLASYDHLLGIFYKAASSTQGHTEILQDVLNEISGQSFEPQDPDDVMFFLNAMRVCLEHKDLEAAYRLHSLMQEGENWRLLGDAHQQSMYYGRFFNILCMMEHIDVVLKWYKELIPSLYYPHSQGMIDLLQALDTDGRLDLIPEIWKDIKQIGHDNKVELVDEMLSLMAREKQSSEVQESFAQCALDVKRRYVPTEFGKPVLEWTANSLGSITSILLAAQKRQQAWEMMKLFKASNRVPTDALMEDFLSSIKEVQDANQAVELVQMSARYCLAGTPMLTERVQKEFELTEDHRATLSSLEFSSDGNRDLTC
ncbi:pentatricopeptide repeat domain-containing protein 3, mitochondrial [Clupea harengus]|uniref:Small ribosomal subunit protein mS39 n=1 Tax=Clupea harengus TaxID=7950 RepID=A0A6P8H5Z7_CLUHA|nr:pentatricopeptide repeat domain-containing protein 3, mitochondrial [Clupea harengus]